MENIPKNSAENPVFSDLGLKMMGSPQEPMVRKSCCHEQNGTMEHLGCLMGKIATRNHSSESEYIHMDNYEWYLELFRIHVYTVYLHV